MIFIDSTTIASGGDLIDLIILQKIPLVLWDKILKKNIK